MRQYRLIKLFMESAGQPVTREQIMQNVRARSPDPDVGAVDAEIIRLRHALGQGANDGPIRTVRGVLALSREPSAPRTIRGQVNAAA